MSCGDCKCFQYGDDFYWCKKHNYAVSYEDEECEEVIKEND